MAGVYGWFLRPGGISVERSRNLPKEEPSQLQVTLLDLARVQESKRDSIPSPTSARAPAFFSRVWVMASGGLGRTTELPGTT